MKFLSGLIFFGVGISLALNGRDFLNLGITGINIGFALLGFWWVWFFLFFYKL